MRKLNRSLLRPKLIAYWSIGLAVLLWVSRTAGQQAPGQVTTQATTVHGVVRVGISGAPLPHALVRIGGDASTGALTDGEGRFEIPEVPAGPQEFTITKPGFLDDAEASADSMAWNAHGYSHNVIVAAQMGDVVFTMEPANSIRGQIQLSTGDTAEGIQVMLLRRTIQDGRAIWQTAGTARTNSESVYRFGGLTDGSYAVYTMPAMESETENFVHVGTTASKTARAGYASVFFPDARDLGSAAKIHLSGGEQSQANISLRLEPFQPVVATVTMPNASAQTDNVAIQVMDAQGNQLPYSAQYDGSTHTAQAMLPEGSYTFQASIATSVFHIAAARDGGRFNLAQVASHGLAGEVSFTVAARAVPNLQMPMAAIANTPVQVSLVGGAQPSGREGADPHVFVTLSGSGGWIGDGMVTSYAEGPASALLRPVSVPAGKYWVHTSIGPRTMCEASFTAGGASVAREPLNLSSSGNTAPLTLTLRNDCARVTLSLPGSVGYTVGEERAYTVYLVPDFESTQDVIPQTLRTSTGGRITLTGLTPGNYHVFTFDRPVALEYRNPAVLAALPGQAVSLAPNENEELTLEFSQR